MRHFKENEFRSYDRMNKGFLEHFEGLRDKYGKPFYLHCDFQERAGYHGLGRAVDFHINDGHTIPTQAAILMGKLDTIGKPWRLGAYPHWKPFPGGFHFDNCDIKTEKTTEGNVPAKWWIRDKNGNYHYYSSHEDFLKSLVIECGLSDV